MLDNKFGLCNYGFIMASLDQDVSTRRRMYLSLKYLDKKPPPAKRIRTDLAIADHLREVSIKRSPNLPRNFVSSESIRAIATKFKVNRERVYNIAKKNDIVYKRCISDWSKTIKSMKLQGKSVQEIADHYNCSRHRIYQILKS